MYVGPENLQCEPVLLRTLRHVDYTVACLCPMGVELAPMEAMLDEIHQSLPTLRDYNSYSLGRIGVHNVVIAAMPETGNSTAAIVATQLLNDFPSVRFGLVVGIGGGIPSTDHDIRLGDVIVSQSKDVLSGVVQYDRGKLTVDKSFTRTGSLNKPPAILTSSVERLKAQHERLGHRLPQTVSNMLSKFPAMRHRYVCPGADKDQLFHAAYIHQGGLTCTRCDTRSTLPRLARPTEGSVIHYGIIGSANVVVKDGILRDILRRDLDVICVEMEAAGVRDVPPCLVVRGVCDYADSHKNKEWQPYAAAIAAAYTKELLQLVSASYTPVDSEVTSGSQSTNRIRDRSTYDDDSEQTSSDGVRPLKMQKTITSFARNTETNAQELGLADYLAALSFDEMDSRHATVEPALRSTCEWMLEQSQFHDWLDIDRVKTHHGLLWVRGKPAAGKSTMMKFLLGEIIKRKVTDHVIFFFFHARGEELEKTTEGLYRSLLLQICRMMPDLESIFQVVLPRGPPSAWTTQVLQELFRQAIRGLQTRSLTCFVDALDECAEEEVRDMVEFLGLITEEATDCGIRLLICFSSRHYPNITAEKSIELVLENQDGHTRDISTYLSSKLRKGRSKQTDQLKTEILRRASGVFLWVVLVVKMLNKEYDSGRVHNLMRRLKEIPTGLHDLFEDIILRDSQNLDELVLCLQWVLFAERPLTSEELYCAILANTDPAAVTSNQDGLDVAKEDIDRFVLDASKGFAEKTKGKKERMQFIHESVREFLQNNRVLGRSGTDRFTDGSGDAHDKLTTSCQAYLDVNIREMSKVEEPSNGMRAEDSKAIHLQFVRRFPFAEYASHYLLRHADKAQAGGVKQQELLDRFDLKTWKQVFNVSERYKTRHSTALSLAQLLIDDCLPHLVLLLRCMKPTAYQVESLMRDRKFKSLVKNRQIVEALLAPTSCLHATGFRSPHDATDAGFQAAVSQFIELQNEVKHLYPNGPLWAALELDEENLAATIIAAEVVNIHAESTFRGRSALSFAAERGFDLVVRALLENGAKASIDRQGRTSLSYAAETGALSTLSALLHARKEHVDLECDKGNTPLMYAMINGHADSIDLLRDISKPVTRRQLTRVLKSIMCHDRLNALKMVMAMEDVDANFRDEDGWTLLCRASINGAVSVVTHLIHSRSANINDCELANRWTPLICAAISGSISIVKQLLSRKDLEINLENNVLHVILKFYALGDSLTLSPTADLKRRQVHILLLLLETGQIAINDVRYSPYDLLCDFTLYCVTDIPSCHWRLSANSMTMRIKVGVEAGGGHALSDYQMQLMLLEQQHKKRLMLARSEEVHRANDDKQIFHREVLEAILMLSIYFSTDLNRRGCRGLCILHILVFQGSHRLAQELCDLSQIDLNIPTEDGMTAIEIAMGLRDIGMVAVLLATSKIDPTVRTISASSLQAVAQASSVAQIMKMWTEYALLADQKGCYYSETAHIKAQSIRDGRLGKEQQEAEREDGSTRSH